MAEKKLNILKAIERELAEPKVVGGKKKCINKATSPEIVVPAPVIIKSEVLPEVESQPEEMKIANVEEHQSANTVKSHNLFADKESGGSFISSETDFSAQEQSSNDSEAEIDWELVEKIPIGISSEELLEIRSESDDIFIWYKGQERYKYGGFWVVIENDVVTCLVKAEDYEKFRGRAKYLNFKPEAIIK